MTKKHISGSGVTEGQWVTCSAQVFCRNGGIHVDSNDLNRAQIWLKHNNIAKPVNQISLQDIINWKNSGFDGSPSAIAKLQKSLAPRITNNFGTLKLKEKTAQAIQRKASELDVELEFNKVNLLDEADTGYVKLENLTLKGTQLDVMKTHAYINQVTFSK